MLNLSPWILLAQNLAAWFDVESRGALLAVYGMYPIRGNTCEGTSYLICEIVGTCDGAIGANVTAR